MSKKDTPLSIGKYLKTRGPLQKFNFGMIFTGSFLTITSLNVKSRVQREPKQIKKISNYIVEKFQMRKYYPEWGPLQEYEVLYY